MSRILRRPMFRGGRVDSRGTGIASGLGYEKGGRVGYAQRGFVGKTPKYTSFSQEAMPWLQNIASTNVAQPKEEINTTDEYITIGTDEGPGSRLGKRRIRNPNYEPPFKWVEAPDIGPGSQRKGGGKPSKRKVYLTEDEIAFSEGDYHPGQAELWREPADTSGTKNGDGGAGTPAKTDAEKLAEYQELFEKAYGRGKGDDISNMLLSFAGKALKPEATTKSAFGEFFEDEAKRPSERKKYKDAATTAAINAFLTGEKTMAEVDAYLSKVRAGKQIEYDMLKGTKNWDTYLIEGAGTGGDPRKMGAISYAVTQMGEELGGVLPELEKGQTYGEILEEGPIYVQDSPDGTFKILVKWDGEKLVPIKQVYKR